MSKNSGGDFGPINAIGILTMIGGIPVLAGFGIFMYRVAEQVDKEIIQSAINVCGIGTVSLGTIIALIFALIVERRKSAMMPPEPPPRVYRELPPQYANAGHMLPPPPSMPALDVAPDKRGTWSAMGAERELADQYTEEAW